MSDFTVRRTIGQDVRRAQNFEHDHFVQAGFCEAHPDKRIASYEPFAEHSRWFLAETPSGREVGVLRTISNSQAGLPIYNCFEIRDELKALDSRCVIAEVGTLAVDQDWRGGAVALALYRAAWRDAVDTGVTHWGAIIEVWLLQVLRDLGFPFEQIGASRWYMGGDCIPTLMGFDEAREHLAAVDLRRYEWFVLAPLDAAAGTPEDRRSPSHAAGPGAPGRP